MKTSIILSKNETELLTSLKGKKILSFVRDPLFAGKSSYGYIGLILEDEKFLVGCSLETARFFGDENEEVAVVHFEKQEGDFHSMLVGVTPIEIHVDSQIISVSLINDSVTDCGETFEYTYGILIKTDRKNYLIHRGVWFSEELSLDVEKEITMIPIEDLWIDSLDSENSSMKRDIVEL